MNLSDMPSPAAEPAAPVAPGADAKAPESKSPEALGGLLAGDKSEAKAAEPKVFKLNVKGQEVSLTEEQAIAMLQKASYADSQIKEATQLKKMTESLMARLKADPWEVLGDPAIGHDTKQLAITRIKKLMEDEAKTPEQREAEQMRAELEAYKRKESETKAEAESRAKAERDTALANELRADIISAIESAPELGKSAIVMEAMIRHMRAGYRKTGRVMPAKEAVELVRQEVEGDFSSRAKSVSVEKLIALFGPEVVEKLKKAELAQFKKGTVSVTPEGKKDFGMKTDKKGRITERDLEKNWSRLVGGL